MKWTKKILKTKNKTNISVNISKKAKETNKINNVIINNKILVSNEKLFKSEKNNSVLNNNCIKTENKQKLFYPNIFDTLVNNENNQLKINKNFLENNGETEINPTMRYTLINWLSEISFKLKYKQKTIHWAYELIDTYLQYNITLKKNQFQLLGISCLIISAKMEEINIPSLKYYLNICNNIYSIEDIKLFEHKILLFFNYNCNRVIKIDYMGFFQDLFNFNSHQKIFLNLILEITYLNKNFYLINYHKLMFSCFIFTSKIYKLNVNSLKLINNIYYFNEININYDLDEINKILKDLWKILYYWNLKKNKEGIQMKYSEIDLKKIF